MQTFFFEADNPDCRHSHMPPLQNKYCGRLYHDPGRGAGSANNLRNKVHRKAGSKVPTAGGNG